MIHSSNYSSLRKTPKAIENTSQKASSSQNLNSKCSAGHANGAKAPIVKLHNSYFMLNQGKIGLDSSGNPKLSNTALLGKKDYSSSTRSSQKREPSIAKTRMVIGYDGGSCMVCAIACVAKVSYNVARQAAIKYGGFVPDKGMKIMGAKKALEHLGIRSTFHPFQPKNWADFPDKAIIGVTVPAEGGRCHVAVFSRKNGQGWVYDSRGKGSDWPPTPCECYGFLDDPTDCELEIDGNCPFVDPKDCHLEIHG